MYTIKQFITDKQLPSKIEVCTCINDLLNFLFPIDNKSIVKKEEAIYKQLTLLLKNEEQNNKAELFWNTIPAIMVALQLDAQLMLDNDPAANSIEEIIICYPGFKAICVYRLTNELYNLNVPLIPRMMSEWAHTQTGIDIHPGAKIDCPFMIDHGTGVVIGESTCIGKNVKIYQGVTLGALAVKKGEMPAKRHPTIEDNVVLYAGSTILGGETVIGNDCIIGGNTWITESVLAYSVVYHKNQTIIKDRREMNDVLNFTI